MTKTTRILLILSANLMCVSPTTISAQGSPPLWPYELYIGRGTLMPVPVPPPPRPDYYREYESWRTNPRAPNRYPQLCTAMTPYGYRQVPC